MNIYCIGNVLSENDNLPLRLMDKLRVAFPKHNFLEADPNENFIPEEGSVIIDTVVGVDTVKVFTDSNDFVSSPHVSVHDYDLSFHLRLLQKMGKLPPIRIIGVPQDMDEKTAFTGVVNLIKSF
jgi:Ni,Fe-hydrogenase maturation factor